MTVRCWLLAVANPTRLSFTALLPFAVPDEQRHKYNIHIYQKLTVPAVTKPPPAPGSKRGIMTGTSIKRAI